MFLVKIEEQLFKNDNIQKYFDEKNLSARHRDGSPLSHDLFG